MIYVDKVSELIKHKENIMNPKVQDRIDYLNEQAAQNNTNCRACGFELNDHDATESHIVCGGCGWQIEPIK